MISLHHERCPDALEMAGDLWQKSPRGHLDRSAQFAAVDLGSDQINVLQIVFECTQNAPSRAALSFADAEDIEAFRRWKERSSQQQARGDAQRHAHEACESSCLNAYGEGGTCREACRQMHGDASCYRRCSDEGAACSSGCALD